MTAAMDIRQTAHYMAVVICTLIVRAFLWLIGILWSVIREIVNGVFRVVISVIVLMLSLITFFGLRLWLLPLEHPTAMAKRTSKTAAQQCRYYEVDNIFEYMVETYINGNNSTFSELYHELNKEARQDFVEFIFNEVNPQYHREIIKQML